MSALTTYRVRAGNAMPLHTSGNNIVFMFGTEKQDLDITECATEIVKSEDMCLLRGPYFSATYKAFPGKVNNNLIFSMTLAKKPVLSMDEAECG